MHHAVDPARLPFRSAPDDYLLFLGRFVAGKGVVEAIDVARRCGMRLVLAAAENDYYRQTIAPLVDGNRIAYHGEVDPAGRAALLGGARALIYPVQADEPFGLVLAEAMTCGTPVAALDRGAVGELVDKGITGGVFDNLDDLMAGLPRIVALDRGRVRARAVERFRPDRMIEGYAAIYADLAASGRPGEMPSSRSQRTKSDPPPSS